ncbi:MAG: phytoene/squalene synthase family protein [Actinomycetes bacterium]
MTRGGARDLDAAGITDPALRDSYARCRALHAAHGRTYYLATMLLPPGKRPYVHALYGFARYADEIVDAFDGRCPAARAHELARWGERILADLRTGASADPVGLALVHTVRTWDVPHAHVEAFLRSMRMDLTVDAYPTYADLAGYMEGSAAAIGLQMTPILGPTTDEAYARARDLGVAFQLTNFIRDVGEDLRRGRVYLPLEDLAAFEVERADLAAGRPSSRLRDLLAFEVARTRALYARARPGIAMLHPSSQACIATAFTLYSAILDEVERSGYAVLDRRVSVPVSRRLRVAAPAIVRARRAWRMRVAPAG